MRYTSRVATAMMVAALIGLGACDENEPSGPPIDSELECGDPGAPEACTLPLEAQASFQVVLTSTSCAAAGNTVTLTSPLEDELTDDACHETAGKTWNFAGPFAAGTVLNFTIQSFELAGPPSFRASGAYPNWTLTFEDGGDSDFNDIVLQVTATPVP